MNRTTAQRSRRISYVLGAAILFLAPVPGKAANLTDVRIGVHEKYTRVVLETDGETPYHIASSAGGEVVLDLGAASEPRAVSSSKSPHLEAVLVKPGPAGGSEIRLTLRVPVDVMMMVLREPDRIVMDLVDTAGQATPAAGQPAPPTSEPEPVAEAPAQPGETTPEPEPEPLAEAPPETAPTEPVQPVAEEDEPEDRQQAGAAPSIPEPAEPDPSAVLAARETPSERAPGRRRPAGSAVDRPSLAVRSSPPAAAEGGFLDRFPAPLNQPLVLAGIGLGVIFVIAFAVLRRKGAAAKEEPITPFAAGEPFSVDEQAAVAEEPESAEQPQDDEADAELPVEHEAAREESSLFDQPVEAEEPPGGEPDEKPSEEPVEEPLEEPAEDQGEIVVAEVAEPVEPVLMPGPSEELERRLAQLEERLEEFIDEKDRLGRQVAAQTEELRVQRAAIARTQRVLRDLSRPGDQATEPVPKN